MKTIKAILGLFADHAKRMIEARRRFEARRKEVERRIKTGASAITVNLDIGVPEETKTIIVNGKRPPNLPGVAVNIPPPPHLLWKK